MGECVSAWAWVDETLFKIFKACVGPPAQCAIIYYRTPGLDVRLGLTNEIVKSVLPKPKVKNGGHPHSSVKTWDALRKEMVSLLHTRRRVAHHPVHITIWGSEDENGKVSDVSLELTSFEIFVSSHEQSRDDEKVFQPLTMTDLKNHATAVQQLSENMELFMSRELATHVQ
jgi:hypothetical protein